MFQIDPDTNVFWFLPPLIIAISVVFSATRFEDWRLIVTHSIRFALYVLSFLGCVYIFLYVVQLDLPWYCYVPVGLIALYFLFGPTRGKKQPAVAATPHEMAQK